MQNAARAVPSSDAEYEQWSTSVQGYIDDNTEAIDRNKTKISELRNAYKAGQGGAVFDTRITGLEYENRTLAERNESLTKSLAIIEATRLAYEEARQVASEELLIRQRFKV